MSLTLAELQAEFPHGSRRMFGLLEVRVIGHDPGHHYPIIVRSERGLDALALPAARQMKEPA